MIDTDLILELYDAGQGPTEITRQTGASKTSIYRILAKHGRTKRDPVMPGFEITQVKTQLDADGEIKSESVTQKPEKDSTPFFVPKGRSVGKITAHVQNGNVVQEWVRHSPDQLHPLDVADMLVKHFETYETRHRILPAPKTYSDQLTLYPLADLHMGMYAWKGDSGQNWDLDIADRVLNAAADKLFARTDDSEEAIILGGGDQMHADNNSNMTSKSGNILQVDGRYDKVLGKTEEFFVRYVERALRKHLRVKVRILKGNHDEHSAVAIAHFLKAWFRNDSRVTVNVSADMHWSYQWGKVMLAATHGHEAKPAQMPLTMAARWPKMWGDTEHRFAHTFHIHNANKFLSTEGGVITETHETPVPQDAYHWGKAYLSGRSLQSIVYDKNDGEVDRSRVSLRKEMMA